MVSLLRNTGTRCKLLPVFKELFSDAAILVDTQDVEKIKEGIYKTLKDEKKRKELIKEGKGLVKKFSWEKTARETLKVLEK